ncbi:MAG: hypothetical protein AB1Z98_04585 [Nannocystaceae bacterium]
MKRTIIDLGLAVSLVSLLAAPAGATAAAPPPASEPGAAPMAEEQVDDQVPTVKVEIQHRGAVLKSGTERLDWGETSAIRLERGERVHDVTVLVTRKDGNAKKMRVVLSYELDGELFIDEYAYDTRANKREVLRTEGVALALTVTPVAFDDGGPKGRKDR